MNIDPSKIKVAPPPMKPLPKGRHSAGENLHPLGVSVSPELREKVRPFAISHGIGGSEAVEVLLGVAFENVQQANQKILHRENIALKLVRNNMDERDLQYLIQTGKLEVHKHNGEDFVNREQLEKLKRKLGRL